MDFSETLDEKLNVDQKIWFLSCYRKCGTKIKVKFQTSQKVVINRKCGCLVNIPGNYKLWGNIQSNILGKLTFDAK